MTRLKRDCDEAIRYAGEFRSGLDPMTFRISGGVWRGQAVLSLELAPPQANCNSRSLPF